MTMRAHIERDSAIGRTDDWGNPTAPIWAPIATPIACNAWETTKQSGHRKVDEDKVAALKTIIMTTPLEVDISIRDRISKIVDRLDRTIFEGPFTVDGGKRLRDHIEWELGGGRIN